jgi:hypothetical protein
MGICSARGRSVQRQSTCYTTVPPQLNAAIVDLSRQNTNMRSFALCGAEAKDDGAVLGWAGGAAGGCPTEHGLQGHRIGGCRKTASKPDSRKHQPTDLPWRRLVMTRRQVSTGAGNTSGDWQFPARIRRLLDRIDEVVQVCRGVERRQAALAGPDCLSKRGTGRHGETTPMAPWSAAKGETPTRHSRSTLSTVVRPHMPMVASNSSCSITNSARTPASPSTARPQNTGRPISTARAPRARALNTSVLRRMPPSIYTSAWPATASTTSGKASMVASVVSR